MDLVHGLLEWTTHGAPEICGKHEFNDIKTWTKDGVDQQSQLRITCDVTDLSPTGPLSQNIGGQDKRIKRPNSSELSFCCVLERFWSSSRR